jgi:hypothetical protein
MDTLASLPWQNLIAGLMGALALAHLLRRWWPGAKAAGKGSCHDTSPVSRSVSTSVNASAACQGGCSGCPSSKPKD